MLWMWNESLTRRRSGDSSHVIGTPPHEGGDDVKQNTRTDWGSLTATRHSCRRSRPLGPARETVTHSPTIERFHRLYSSLLMLGTKCKGRSFIVHLTLNVSCRYVGRVSEFFVPLKLLRHRGHIGCDFVPTEISVFWCRVQEVTLCVDE